MATLPICLSLMEALKPKKEVQKREGGFLRRACSAVLKFSSLATPVFRFTFFFLRSHSPCTHDD